jgi:hypothetical protein
MSATDICSWYAYSAAITGANEHSGNEMRGYGTRLVWNSVRSTFSWPSKRSEAVMDEMHCAMRRFRFDAPLAPRGLWMGTQHNTAS